MIRQAQQLNNSISKNKYSFGKDQRNTGFSKRPLCDNIYYYKAKQQKGMRFNKSSRSSQLLQEFQSSQITPSPLQYRIMRMYDRQNRNGIKFAESKRKDVHNHYPGPGKYYKQINWEKHIPPFTVNANRNQILVHTPGPGVTSTDQQYRDRDNLKGNLNYIQSKNHKGINVAISKQKRFLSSNQFTPGPGQYRIKTDIQRSNNHKDFGQAIRLKKSDQKLPGPGSYKLPSDFGYLLKK